MALRIIKAYENMLDVQCLIEQNNWNKRRRFVLFFLLPKLFVVKIGFDGDVGDGKVECSLEDIKWTGRVSIFAETRWNE